MNTQLISNLKRIATRLLAVLMVALLLLPAYTSQPQPAGVEEITFRSGEVMLVGEVGGRIALPHENSAAINLFFENTAIEGVTVVALEPGQRTYVTSLPAGVYHAYTWLSPDFRQKGALTNCRLDESCTDHTLRPFTVIVGATVSGVDITDCYTPAGEPLVIAGTLVDGTGADPMPDAFLVIREERMVAVGTRAQAAGFGTKRSMKHMPFTATISIAGLPLRAFVLSGERKSLVLGRQASAIGMRYFRQSIT